MPSLALPYPVATAPAQTSLGGVVYTTWPGGVDPTSQNYSFGVRPFFTSTGGARKPKQKQKKRTAKHKMTRKAMSRRNRK